MSGADDSERQFLRAIHPFRAGAGPRRDIPAAAELPRVRVRPATVAKRVDCEEKGRFGLVLAIYHMGSTHQALPN